MLIGLVALAAMPNLTSSETELVIPYMCNIIAGTHGLLAQILMIVFLIGVLAVGLSTANALLMVMSSIIYKDLSSASATAGSRPPRPRLSAW